MRLLIAAGSSGGHIFPAIATAFKLKESKKMRDVFFVGSNKELDTQIFKNGGYAFDTLSASRRIVSDFRASHSILKRVRPDIVVGFGGYVSLPVVMTARLLGIPTIIHEQNVVPGLANRILLHVADRVAVSFPPTPRLMRRSSRIRETGNPVRIDLVRAERGKTLARLGLDPSKFTLLVMGGSQGAHRINEAVLEMLSGSPGENRWGGVQVIHLSGMRDFDEVKTRYRSVPVGSAVFSFYDKMGEVYSAADLVISRAGATSIAEITFFGLASILIPYPDRKVHQLENARFMEGRGASRVILQEDLLAQRLEREVAGLLASPGRREAMADNAKKLARPDAAENIIEEILSLAKGPTR